MMGRNCCNIRGCMELALQEDKMLKCSQSLNKAKAGLVEQILGSTLRRRAGGIAYRPRYSKGKTRLAASYDSGWQGFICKGVQKRRCQALVSISKLFSIMRSCGSTRSSIEEVRTMRDSGQLPTRVSARAISFCVRTRRRDRDAVKPSTQAECAPDKVVTIT
jgi:hypothetical protein